MLSKVFAYCLQFKNLNRVSFVNCVLAILILFLMCFIYPLPVMSIPSTVPGSVCRIVLSASLMSAVFLHLMLTTLNLSLLVLIFHLCSELSIVLIACAVCNACMAADLDRCGIICVMSSAYAMYSVFPYKSVKS